MYNTEQLGELTAFLQGQMVRLAALVSEPLEPGDSVFVTEEMPSWMGAGMECLLQVRWVASDPEAGGDQGVFLLSMQVNFPGYYRRMELTQGGLEEVRGFVGNAEIPHHLALAINDLMGMERG